MLAQPRAGMWLHVPNNDDQARALGIMREARAAKSRFPAVAFLWFYKALEACVGNAKVQVAKGITKPHTWVYINDVAGRLRGRSAARIRELGSAVPNLGEYVHSQKRNSIAHAADPSSFYDPHQLTTIRAIREDLPIVEDLAILAMNEVLNIPTQFEMIELDRRAPSAAPLGWHTAEVVPQGSWASA